MSTITIKGKRFGIKGDIPSVGETAPDFTFVRQDFSEATLYDDYEGKIKVIIAVPSLDTRVCEAETRRFNEELAKRPNVTGLVVSRDLPYATKRVCELAGISNIEPASDYRYGDFMDEYNTEILEGPMKGLSARAVFILDSKNKIRYSELVLEVSQEPNYEAALKVLDAMI